VIAAYHLIWTVYGWWLPNDPRGSTSREIRATSIASLGELHFGRKRVQPTSRELREFRDAARGVLKHALLQLSASEMEAAGRAFAEVIRARCYTCYACAILPDHVHFLIRKHRDQAETMIAQLQEASRTAVRRCGSRGVDHPVWGGHGWKVFLETRDDIERTVVYIRRNLDGGRQAARPWPFVKPYDGWLPGQARIVRQADKTLRL
jgi:REP element-mobilizing transposase RayT